MNFNLNETYWGFRLMDTYQIHEINSLVNVFQHDRSGARVIHISNSDDNKVFTISFRTPPSDNTGVAHVLEHCVLSGSKKYTTKEPFMDMVKGSLKTYINATTFNDYTMYATASRNEKDFCNLMSVYLDSVFYPKMYEEQEIFMQEGWFYNLLNREDKITYNGVVYNEMKGDYSSPLTILRQEINESLYPDTPYRFSSGGDPEKIPDLTFKNLKDFHKTFYHPSNSYITIYGNGDIGKYLSFMNVEYLSKFLWQDVKTSIDFQMPFRVNRRSQTYYNITTFDKKDNRSYLSANFVLGESTDAETYLMVDILRNLLIEFPSAPLKKALIDNGLGEDVIFLNNKGFQPSISIIAKNIHEDLESKFEEILFATFNTLVKEGINRSLIESCINLVEYDLREADRFPTKGIVYSMRLMDSWIYDGHSSTHLCYNETLSSIKAKISSNYFESFIEDNLINNTHFSIVTMNPKVDLSTENNLILERKLDEYKKSLSEAELNRLIDSNNALIEKQLRPDTAEALATIPKLSIHNVSRKAEEIPQEVIQENDFTILYHNVHSSSVAYVDFLFDTSIIEQDLIPYVALLVEIIGNLDTQTYTYSELSSLIHTSTGGIELSNAVYVEQGRSKKYHPKLVIGGKAIGEKIADLMRYIKELITFSKIDDKKRIKELLLQIKSKHEIGLFHRGSSIVSKRVSSYYSPSFKYSEQIEGLDFFWFIQHITETFDKDGEQIISNLLKVYRNIFNQNNLIIAFVGDEVDFELFKKNYHIVTTTLNRNKVESKVYHFEDSRFNEGILSSSPVQYVAKGYNFNYCGYEYSGCMNVLKKILSDEYLHNRVRARGGAYAVGVNITRNGNVIAVSYRDPNLKGTLTTYDSMAQFIREIDIDQESLDRYIIGSISEIDRPLTPYMKGELATQYYICKISQSDLQRERDQILSTTPNDLIALSKVIDESMKKNFICVLGNETTISENSEMFETLINLTV